MRRILLFLACLLALPAAAQTAAFNGLCFDGGRSAVTQGSSSTNKLLGIIPSCTVTVYLTGTTTLATVYKDAIGTPLANPFTANNLSAVAPGQWLFFASIGQGYDVVMSGGIPPLTYPASVTLVDLLVGGGGGSGGITQLTQDVLAGPGTGSLPAEVVGIRTELIPTLTSGYLHWTGTAFVWDTPSSAGCTTTGTGIFQLSNGSGGCGGSPADYGVTVTNGYTFPATGSGGAANDATFNITLTENGSSDHSAGIYTILTDNGANAYGADWNYIAASDGTRSAGWLTILNGGIGTFGANWELDSSTGSTLPSHNAANDSSNMWLNFVGGGGENTIAYTNSASFEVSTTCDNFATNSCNAEFSLDGNSDSSENFIVTTNVGTPADSTAGNIELDASGTAGGGAISLDASGGISLADSSSAGIAINEGSTGPIIVAANNIELLTLTPADATLNSSEICTMATGCGSGGVTMVNSNTGALQINFSSGAGSCSYSGGLTTCSITGSGSGGGTVSDFIASAGSWPTWLVPSVATSTTTPTLSVSAGAIPNSALANDTMTINSTVCTLGGSCTVSGAGTPGGTSGQSQYNNAGAFGGYTMSGDATLNTSTGAITVTKSSGTPFGTAAFATLGNSGSDIPQLSAGLLNNSVINWASPGNIGTGTPGQGNFTTLKATSIAGSATYCLQISNAGVISNTGAACPAAGGSAFSSLTGGTNTSAAMVVGTGASLGVSGSGTIAATTATTATTASAAPFSGLTGSTNTTAHMLVGTGASLASTGSGTIAATSSLTANALASTPTTCTTGQFAAGVLANGNATGCATPSGGGNVNLICSGTFALGTSAIASGASAAVITQNCTGLLTTDNIMLDFNGDPTSTVGYQPSTNGMLTIIKWPSANTINVKVVNNTSASVTPGAISVNYRVVR